MIWKKQTFTDTGSLKVRYGNVFEYMFVFTKGKCKTFNPIKDREAITKNRKKSGTVTQATGDFKEISSKGKPYNKLCQRFNIWEINTCVSNVERTGHPAQFPEQLAKDHIISWSNKGDVVLDPFMGSGTTAKVSMLLNRNWIGSEISAEYVNITNIRLKNTEVEIYREKSEVGLW